LYNTLQMAAFTNKQSEDGYVPYASVKLVSIQCNGSLSIMLNTRTYPRGYVQKDGILV